MTKFEKGPVSNELTVGQCCASLAYLVTMLAVLWFSTASVALVMIVLAICALAGTAHVRLSRCRPVLLAAS